MKNPLRLAAKVATAIALSALIAGQWALLTGPFKALREQAGEAAKNSHFGDFAIMVCWTSC